MKSCESCQRARICFRYKKLYEAVSAINKLLIDFDDTAGVYSSYELKGTEGLYPVVYECLVQTRNLLGEDCKFHEFIVEKISIIDKLRFNEYPFNRWPDLYADGEEMQNKAREIGKSNFMFFDGTEWDSSADNDRDFVGDHVYKLSEGYLE